VVFQPHLVPVPSMLSLLQQACSRLHLNIHRERDSNFKILCRLNQAYCKISRSLSLSHEMKTTKTAVSYCGSEARGPRQGYLSPLPRAGCGNAHTCLTTRTVHTASTSSSPSRPRFITTFNNKLCSINYSHTSQCKQQQNTTITTRFVAVFWSRDNTSTSTGSSTKTMTTSSFSRIELN